MKNTTSTIPKTQVRDLPSKFRPYPEGLEVYCRPYTLGELKSLSGDLSKKEILELIIEGVSVEGASHFDKRDLTLADVSFLALMRKVLSLGKDGEVGISAKIGGKDYSRVVKFAEVEFEELKVEALPIRVQNLGGKKEVSFFPTTLRSLLRLLQFFPNKDEDEIYLMAATYMVASQKLEIEANVAFLSGLAGEDQQLIGLVDQKLNHGVKPIELQPKDGEGKASVLVSLTDSNLDFFRPKSGADNDLESRLRFGAK